VALRGIELKRDVLQPGTGVQVVLETVKRLVKLCLHHPR
jgi:hypothetical protein